MSYVLGIDMGGTATRWVRLDPAGTICARGMAPGATGHLFNPDARAAFCRAIHEIAGSQQGAEAPSGLRIGATGLGPAAYDAAKAILADALGVPSAAIATSDDMELAYRAVFAPGEGHLIAAGTGSIGLHITADGEPIRVGGRGILIDDGGSGAWIALRALDRLYRILDMKGEPQGAEILAQNLFEAMGGSDWDATRAYVYGGDRGRIGTLAACVARAAQAGDPVAQGVMAEAVDNLARLAHALVGRGGEGPVGFVGGVLDLTPDFQDALTKALAGHAIRFPKVDAAEAAARMALAQAR